MGTVMTRLDRGLDIEQNQPYTLQFFLYALNGHKSLT